MTMNVNVGGTWKQITDAYYKVGGSWKKITGGWQKVGGIWKRIYTSTVIPAGAIVLYYSTGSTPTGWTEYADVSRILKGWDGTAGTIGGTGGSQTVPDFTSVTDPSHTGTIFSAPYWIVYTAGSYVRNSRYAAGSHSHTISQAGGNTYPALVQGKLIQADNDTYKLPANSVVFGDNLTTLTEIEASAAYPYIYHDGGAAGGSILPINQSTTFGTNTVGAHSHSPRGYPYGYAQTGYYYKENQGNHSHSFSITDISWNLQRKYVKAFTNIAEDFPAYSGSIVGWESDTPPEGWALCNGSNGTIDLRDYFVCCDSTATYGSTTGDNSLTFTYTTDSAGSHNHQGSYVAGLAMYGTYHSNNRAHTHSGSKNISQQWSYLQLAFIQAL